MTERVFISGHRGMVGSAVCRRLGGEASCELLVRGREQLDLSDQRAVFEFFERERPQAQIICAAVVGGIVANDTYPADFIGHNLMIQTNLLEAARRFGCERTIFMASSCIYPRDTAQPMCVEQLLTGDLERTNEWYAVAKLAGIKMAQAYRRQFGLAMVSFLPTNLYGENDNFDLENSHVVPGVMRRIHLAKQAQAKSVTIWGSGKVHREFLHVDDLADAAAFVLQQMRAAASNGDEAINNIPEILNVGYGEDITIAELAQKIKAVVGFEGDLEFDTSRPDGTPRKLLDSSVLRGMGWHAKINLTDGLRQTYDWFLQHADEVREASPDKWRASA